MRRFNDCLQTSGKYFCQLQYEKAMHTKSIPIGATIRYGSFVLSSEFEELLAKFTAMEMEINGCKKRTARGNIDSIKLLNPKNEKFEF